MSFPSESLCENLPFFLRVLAAYSLVLHVLLLVASSASFTT